MKIKTHNRRHAGVGLFLLGSLIFAVGAWLPWMVDVGVVITHPFYFDPGTPPPGSAGLTPLLGALHDPLAIILAWSLVTILGLALGPLLTAHAPGWLPRVGHALAGLWLLGTTVLVVAIIVAIVHGPYGQLPYCELCKAGSPMLSGPVSLQFGPFVAVAGLVLGWIGWALAFSEMWRVSSKSGSVASVIASAPARRFEFGLLGTGIVIWALGFYLMPWVTYNCGTVWFFGTCSGYPANAVAQAALSSQQVLDPAIMMDAVPLLLGIGALYLVVTLARRTFGTRAARAWLGAWLVLALAVEWLALMSAQEVIHNSDTALPHISVPVGTQMGIGAGMVVAAFGLVLLVVGLIVTVAMSLLERSPQPPEEAP